MTIITVARTLILASILALSGCATLQDALPPAPTSLDEIATSPYTFAGCTALDTASTVYLVGHNLAHEVNPLLSGSVNAHHFVPLVLSKLAVIGLIWWIWTKYHEQPAAELGIGGASVITCGVGVQNLLLIGR